MKINSCVEIVQVVFWFSSRTNNLYFSYFTRCFDNVKGINFFPLCTVPRDIFSLNVAHSDELNKNILTS